MWATVVMRGCRFPDSSMLIACLDTPDRSASPSCVKPALSRYSRRTVPNRAATWPPTTHLRTPLTGV